VSYKFIDRGIFEILGPTGLSLVSLNIASNLHKMQSGFYHYTLVILMGGACLLGQTGLVVVWFFFRLPSTYRYFLFYSFS
jgi:hypothetical protein